MNNQGQQLNVPGQSDTSSVQSAVPANQADRPKPQLTDSDAQSLLAASNLEVAKRPKTKTPITLLIVTLILVALVIAASFAIGELKHGTSSGSTDTSGSTGSSSQSNPSNGQGVSNQINQDVNSCSNPVNAATVC